MLRDRKTITRIACVRNLHTTDACNIDLVSDAPAVPGGNPLRL